jgi:hypothetical protein
MYVGQSFQRTDARYVQPSDKLNGYLNTFVHSKDELHCPVQDHLIVC